MTDAGPIAALAWLVFIVGIGVILIAVVSKQARMRSQTRRIAGVLSGLVFCLLAATVIVPGLSGNAQVGLAIAAGVAAAASWYLGLHARKMDKMAHKK